jgi:hypothetical protein
VLASDDDTSGGTTLKSSIPAGSFTGGRGPYVLAVSTLGHVPITAAGSVFPAGTTSAR